VRVSNEKDHQRGGGYRSKVEWQTIDGLKDRDRERRFNSGERIVIFNPWRRESLHLRRLGAGLAGTAIPSCIAIEPFPVSDAPRVRR